MAIGAPITGVGIGVNDQSLQKDLQEEKKRQLVQPIGGGGSVTEDAGGPSKNMSHLGGGAKVDEATGRTTRTFEKPQTPSMTGIADQATGRTTRTFEKPQATGPQITPPKIQPIQAGPQAIPPKVEAPPELGVDFGELNKQLETNRKRLVDEAKADKAVNLKNVKNAFSHIYSKGKDAGFINAKNLAGVREANRSFDDVKTSLDNSFFSNQIRLSELEATEDSRIRQSQNDKWESNIKNQIDSLMENGLFEEASALAREAAEVSPNNFFSSISDPAIMQALIDDQDIEKAGEWKGINKEINDLALNSVDAPSFQRNQAIISMFDEMKGNPARSKILISNFFETIDEEAYEDLEITENDREVIESFNRGELGVDSDELQRVFGNAYMDALKMDMTRKNNEQAVDAIGLSSLIKNSRVGNEFITEYWTNPNRAASFISIDVEQDPLFGTSGINEISFFGQPIDDPNQLAGLPGLDIGFETFDGTPITDEYTLEDAMAETINVGGQEYNQGRLMLENLKYIDSAGREYNKLSPREQAAYEPPLNKDEWFARLREMNKGSDSIVSFKELNDSIKGIREVGDRTAGANEYVINGEVEPLPDSLQLMDEDQKSVLISILEGSKNINNLDVDDMQELLFAGTTGEDVVNPAVINLLKKEKGLQTDRSLPRILQKGYLVEDKGNAFSQENMEDTLSGLNVEGGKAYGYMYVGGVLYSVDGQPGRHHPSTDAKWIPTVNWSLTPVGSGRDQAPVEFRTRIPGSVRETKKGRASEVSRDYLNNFGGE